MNKREILILQPKDTDGPAAENLKQDMERRGVHVRTGLLRADLSSLPEDACIPAVTVIDLTQSEEIMQHMRIDFFRLDTYFVLLLRNER